MVNMLPAVAGHLSGGAWLSAALCSWLAAAAEARAGARDAFPRSNVLCGAPRSNLLDGVHSADACVAGFGGSGQVHNSARHLSVDEWMYLSAVQPEVPESQVQRGQQHEHRWPACVAAVRTSSTHHHTRSWRVGVAQYGTSHGVAEAWNVPALTHPCTGSMPLRPRRRPSRQAH